MTLVEVNQACSLIQEAAHEDANIIFGSVIDDAMDDRLKITVIATGFTSRDARRIERMDATRAVRGPQGTLAMPHATEPAGPRHAAPQRTPEMHRAATPPPGPARVTPAPPPPREKPVRHISWDELRQMTGASEDELDIPTFLRNGE